MRNILIACLFTFSLIACATAPETPLPLGDNAETMLVKGRTATPPERARCEALGGTIERAGRIGYERCTRPYADAGQTCNDSRQCGGKCLYVQDHMPIPAGASGQCQTDDNPFGCSTELKRGERPQSICVD